MPEMDISAEKDLIEGLGCQIAAWSNDALVIQFQHYEQREQLIIALRSLGWAYPVSDPDDADAMLLELRRTPLGLGPPVTFKASPIGLYILAFFGCLLVGFCFYDVLQGINRHHAVRALMTGLTYLLITALIIYTGLPYVTLKVRLGPQEITLVNALQAITLRVVDIKNCTIQTFSAFGAPLFTIAFIMRNGAIYKMPAPFRGFQRLKDEIRKRYPFSVSG